MSKDSNLRKFNENSEELEHFSDLYRDILEKIGHEVENERLSAFSKGVIISLIHKVAYKMTMSRENVQKRTGDIMGGRVLDQPGWKFMPGLCRECVDLPNSYSMQN